MAENNDGGSAFPREAYAGDHRSGQCGMTLRDYFAGQALLGAVSGWSQDAGARAELAKRAYLVADAMIAERAK